MRSILIMVILSVAITGIHFAHAEEPLFDTEAAAKHIEKGITFLKEKKYDAAITELEEAVAINPDAEAHYYLGYAYYMKGRKDDPESRKKSIENFNDAYELNPNFTPSRYKPEEPLETDMQPPAPAASPGSNPEAEDNSKQSNSQEQ